MIKIALVDDNEADRNALKSYVERFQNSSRGVAEELSIDCYGNGMDFMTDYDLKYDLVFMDVKMPLLDGLETAKRLRETDKDVGLIFVTAHVEYAIYGYEVEAMDFIVKPVSYSIFAEKLNKALAKCIQKKTEKIFLKVETGYVSLDISKIYYLEKREHNMVYYTAQGVYHYRMNMNDAEQYFLRYNCFVKCTRGCIVNLHAVTKIDKNGVYIGSEYIRISRGLQQSFKQRLQKYLKGN